MKIKIQPSYIYFLVGVFAFANVSYFTIFFYYNHYLPAPFVWDKDDTFMDFYNPLFWVVNGGFYTTYNSVYPAINYYLLQIFSYFIDSRFLDSPKAMRDANFTLSLFLICLELIVLFFVINFGEWKKIKSKKIIIFLFIIFSTPVLFTIERGNIIFISILFLALFFETTNVWFRAIFFGILVNIKPYFLILMVLNLNIYNFNIRAIFRDFGAVILIFLIPGILVGINFIRFFSTYLGFVGGFTMSVDGILAMPNTLFNLIYARELLNLPSVTTYRFWFSTLKVLYYLGPILLLLVSLVKPLSQKELVISSLILLANFSIGTGGYIYIIYIVLIPYLLCSARYCKLSYLVLLIYFLPLDWIQIIKVAPREAVFTYLGGDELILAPTLWVGLGSLLRPAINFTLLTVFTIQLLNKYQFFRIRHKVIPID